MPIHPIPRYHRHGLKLAGLLRNAAGLQLSHLLRFYAYRLIRGVSGRSFLQWLQRPEEWPSLDIDNLHWLLLTSISNPHTDHDKNSFASCRLPFLATMLHCQREFSPTWSLGNGSFTILHDHFSCGCFTVAGVHPLLCPHCLSKLLRLDVAIECCLQGTPSHHCPQRVPQKPTLASRETATTLQHCFVLFCSDVLLY